MAVRELTVTDGPDTGRSAALGDEPLSVGRGVADGFILHDPCVTRGQLLFEWDPVAGRHSCTVTGDSFTAINGATLPRLSGARMLLAEGDVIRVGATSLRYERQAAKTNTEASP